MLFCVNQVHPPFLKVVDTGIHDDPLQPCPEGRLIPERTQLTESIGERLLEHILRFLLHIGHPVADVVHGLAVKAVQLVLRPNIPFLARFDYIPVYVLVFCRQSIMLSNGKTR